MIIPLYPGSVFVRQFSSKSSFIARTMLLDTETRYNITTILALNMKQVLRSSCCTAIGASVRFRVRSMSIPYAYGGSVIVEVTDLGKRVNILSIRTTVDSRVQIYVM